MGLQSGSRTTGPPLLPSDGEEDEKEGESGDGQGIVDDIVGIMDVEGIDCIIGQGPCGLHDIDMERVVAEVYSSVVCQEVGNVHADCDGEIYYGGAEDRGVYDVDAGV